MDRGMSWVTKIVQNEERGKFDEPQTVTRIPTTKSIPGYQSSTMTQKLWGEAGELAIQSEGQQKKNPDKGGLWLAER
jgi:hypothetical protein